MIQWSRNDFIKMLEKNGYSYLRSRGSHSIYVKKGNHITVPLRIKAVIARRLIKENNLNINL